MKIHQVGKKPNRKNTPTKIAGKSGQTAYGAGSRSEMHGKAWDIFDTEDKTQSFKVRRKSKYVPKGIDPAYPQKNFVKAHYENKGDMAGFYSEMYGHHVMGPQGYGEFKNKAHGYGHKKRCGDLRLSGSSRAHQIGKR